MDLWVWLAQNGIGVLLAAVVLHLLGRTIAGNQQESNNTNALMQQSIQLQSQQVQVIASLSTTLDGLKAEFKQSRQTYVSQTDAMRVHVEEQSTLNRSALLKAQKSADAQAKAMDDLSTHMDEVIGPGGPLMKRLDSQEQNIVAQFRPLRDELNKQSRMVEDVLVGLMAHHQAETDKHEHMTAVLNTVQGKIDACAEQITAAIKRQTDEVKQHETHDDVPADDSGDTGGRDDGGGAGGGADRAGGPAGAVPRLIPARGPVHPGATGADGDGPIEGEQTASNLYLMAFGMLASVIIAVTTLAGVFGWKAASGIPIQAIEKGALQVGAYGASLTTDPRDDHIIIDIARKRGYTVEQRDGLLMISSQRPPLPETVADGPTDAVPN